MSVMDLTAKIRIVLEIDRPGPEMAQLAEGVQTVGVRIAEINQIQNTYRQTTVSTTASVRNLLLNLRMFSFGIRTLRREFGDTNPVLESFSTAMITVAAAGTMAVSGVALITQTMAKLSPYLISTSKEAVALAASMAGLGITWSMVAVTAGLVVAIPLASWAMDSISGISALRQEAKDLESDLAMIENRLKSMSAEQDKFNLGMSATQIHMRELKRAIDLAGGSNEALESQLAAITAEYENMGIEASKASLAEKELLIVQTEGKTLQDDLIRLANARKYAQTQIAGHPGAYGFGEDVYYETMKALGTTTGRPSVQQLREYTGREKGAAGLGGGTTSPSVTINFPGAIFNTEGDIEAALQSGAEKAGRIIYNQYGTPGSQR